MTGLVLDTHATIWYLEGSSRLSATVLASIRALVEAGSPVFVSTVTLVELIYLVEKGRFPAALLDRLLSELQRADAELAVACFDLDTAECLRTVPMSIRDMPDRMIAATALMLGMPLATRDQQIRASGIPIVW